MKAYKDPEIVKHFIQRIYQAVMEPDSIYDVMSDLRAVVDAPFSAFQIENAVTHELGRSYLIDYDDKAVDIYAKHYIGCDPWTIAGLENGILQQSFHAAQRYVPDSIYRESEFYRDWGRFHNIRHAVGCCYDIDDGSILKLSFQRGADQKPFDTDIEYFLNILHPHFKQFARLSPIFENKNIKNMNFKNSLEHFDRPMWIVGANLCIKFMNSQAEQWLSRNECLRSVNNRLLAIDHFDQVTLEHCVQSTCALTKESVVYKKDINARNERITLGMMGSPECFWITPFINEEKENLVLITGRKVIAGVSTLMNRHGLTHRQSQLCTLLAQGSNIQDSALQLNISVNTARNMLAACFRVLKVRNQSELIRVLWGDFSV